MGGHHHVRLILVQQPVQPAQQAVPPAVAGVVHRQVVIDIVKDPAVGHQHVKPPIHGGGQLGDGVFKQVYNPGPVSILGQLLPQGVGGGQMAHAEFTCQYQNVHEAPPHVGTGGARRLSRTPKELARPAFLTVPIIEDKSSISTQVRLMFWWGFL